MWPFKRKVEIEGFCQEFYNTRVFRPVVREKDYETIFWDAAYRRFNEADPSFSAVDTPSFQREFGALRVELFGLAWVHHAKEEEFVVREIVFLRSYLENMRRLDTWEALEAYNRAVLASVGESEKMELGRAAAERRWMRAGILADCARRAANRLETAEAWDSGAIGKALAFVFLQRLDCRLNARGNETAVELVHRLFEDASSEIESVKVRAA